MCILMVWENKGDLRKIMVSVVVLQVTALKQILYSTYQQPVHVFPFT